MNSTGAKRWRSRETSAAVVRAVVRFLPPGAGLGAALLLHLLVPSASGGVVLLRWLAILAVSFVIALGVERASRRLLPLATLLRLNLVFPDEAPARWSIALRAGSTRNLETLIAEAERAGHEDDVTEAARAILALGAALSNHDRATRGHSERVRALSEVLGQHLGLDDDDLDRLRWAAFLHDLGKLSVHGHILNKPDDLDDDEWDAVRRHPEEGARLAAPLAEFLGPWADTILEHHERWDGHGYPARKSGEQISVGARIVGVADAFEVMTSRVRTYRPSISPAAAKTELVQESGRQFDPTVVRALLDVGLGDLRRAMGMTLWVGQLPFLGVRLGGAPVADGVASIPQGAQAAGTSATLPPAASLPTGAEPSAELGSQPVWIDRQGQLSAARRSVNETELVNDDDL